MPTNNEKRYFTAVLRYASTKASTLSIQEILYDMLGVGGSEIFGRLADFIDPDMTEDATKIGEDTTTPNYSETTPKCDRDALLTLADEIDERFRALQGLLETGSDFKNFMGVSGALGYEFERHEIAERIREACGVAEDA